VPRGTSQRILRSSQKPGKHSDRAAGLSRTLTRRHDCARGQLASGTLAGYHLLPATRADLLRRLGHRAEAAAAYRDAIELAPTDAERRYLHRRLAEITFQS